MADLSDVTTYLAGAAAAAVYPNGLSQPSVAAMDCRIYEGWPVPEQLDLDISGHLAGSPPTVRPGGKVANVSVYPMPGTGVTIPQHLDETYTIIPFVPGITVQSVVGSVVTVSGQPKPGEYLTLICDGVNAFSQTGANTAAVLAALAAQAQAIYGGSSSTSTTLTIPFLRSIVVRQGGMGTVGKGTHRQRHQVMITAWTPDKVSRALLAGAIDVAIKNNIRITLPDTSQAIVCYSRTNTSDEQQATGIYRRDLVYEVEYATVSEFPAFVVTTSDVRITAIGNGNILADPVHATT